MNILDSHKKNKWQSHGVSFVEKNFIMSAKSSLSANIPKINGVNIKIVGKKISGNGHLNLSLKNRSGEILFSTDMSFTKNSWSEQSVSCNKEVINGVLEFARSKRSFGRIEIARIVLEDRILEELPSKRSRAEEITSEVLDNYLKNIINITHKKRIAVIIPYGIYGGGEVYLKSIFEEKRDAFNIDFLYLSKNKLEFEISNPSINHRYIRNMSMLSTVLSSNKHDIILFYNSRNVYNLISSLKDEKKIRSKVIEIYHSDFLWQDAVAHLRSRSNVDFIFKVSENLADDISGVSSFNKILMPVGIDTDLFIRKEDKSLRRDLNIPRDKTVFGMVARLSPEKNIEYALKLVKDLSDIHLVIAGSGPLGPRLQKFAQDNNIDNISFLGYKKNIQEYYNIFDAFLLTSKMEGTPISIIEAMSCCLPIYSTDVGQIKSNFGHLDNFNILSGSLKSDRKLIRSQIDQQNYHQNLREYIIKNHNIKAVSNKFFMNILSSALTFREKSRDSKVIFGEYI